MRWTTTDPRSAGLADSVGATINYVSSGAFVTLVKVSTGSTDWAAVDAVLPPAPLTQCPKTSSDPRTAGRKGAVDEVVLYYTATAGTYLIKYGSGDTDWVALPTMFNPGVGSEGDVYTTVSGVATWQAPTSGGLLTDPIFSGGQDGAISFDGSAVTVATLAGSTYTLTQNVAATDVYVAATYIVKTAGYALFCNGTLSGTGTIQNNGSAGTSIVTGSETGNGGAGAPGATLPAGAAGGNGAINSSSSASDGAGSTNAPIWNPVGAGGAGGASTGGNGAAGGQCKGGGSGGRKGYSVGAQAGRAGGSVGSINKDSAFTQCLISGRALIATTSFGPSTGGAGAPSPDSYNDSSWVQGRDGAGGGGTGGWVVVCAYNCTFTGTIEAKGGAGGDGNSYNVSGASGGSGGPGGGGGAGGTIVCIIGKGTLPTLDVAGGAGGIGGQASGGTAANDKGGDGGAGGDGKVITINLSV